MCRDHPRPGCPAGPLQDPRSPPCEKSGAANLQNAGACRIPRQQRSKAADTHGYQREFRSVTSGCDRKRVTARQARLDKHEVLGPKGKDKPEAEHETRGHRRRQEEIDDHWPASMWRHGLAASSGNTRRRHSRSASPCLWRHKASPRSFDRAVFRICRLPQKKHSDKGALPCSLPWETGRKRMPPNIGKCLQTGQKPPTLWNMITSSVGSGARKCRFQETLLAFADCSAASGPCCEACRYTRVSG